MNILTFVALWMDLAYSQKMKDMGMISTVPKNRSVIITTEGKAFRCFGVSVYHELSFAFKTFSSHQFSHPERSNSMTYEIVVLQKMSIPIEGQAPWA